jgi:peptidoglycan lytic transglycosylase
MLRLSNFLWILLLVGAFLALGSDRAEARTGLASWYGPGFEGLPTASGEPYDPYGYTVAHKRMRLGTELLVSYVGGRDLDLSQGAAEYIGLTHAGVDYVEYSRTGGYDPRYETYPADTGYSSSSGTESYASSDVTGGGTYVVQAGDTMSGIAAQLGTSVEDLAAANGITNPDLIYIGQTLYY